MGRHGADVHTLEISHQWIACAARCVDEYHTIGVRPAGPPRDILRNSVNAYPGRYAQTLEARKGKTL